MRGYHSQRIRSRNMRAALDYLDDCMEDGEEVPAWVDALLNKVSDTLVRFEIDKMIDTCPGCWSARLECCCLVREAA